MRIDEFSFCYAKEYLLAKPEIHSSILAAVVNAQEEQLRRQNIPIANLLREEFKAEGWSDKTPIIEGKFRGQYFDFYKSRVAIEIEFSRYEFIHHDLIRFLAAYNAGKIDVGVIITNTKAGLKRVKYKSSGANYERVLEELGWLRTALTIPVWLVGLR